MKTLYGNIEVINGSPENTNGVTKVLILTRVGQGLIERVLARGLNTWDTAPVELKELADILMYGKPMQDYANIYRQHTNPKAVAETPFV